MTESARLKRYSNGDAPLCPECKTEMVSRCGRWECLNDNCSVISFDWRGVHKDCTMEKEVAVES
jgi:hypothetical protein